MSLVVVNGVRFLDSDLARLTEAMIAFRPVIHDLTQGIERRWLAYRCTSMIDAALIEEKPSPRHVLVTAIEELWDFQKKLRDPAAIRNPAIDVEFSIVAAPFEGELFGLVFTEQPPLRDAFDALGIAEPYWYEGRTDRPDEIEPEDWDRRFDVWTALLKRSPTRAWTGCGLTYEFAPPTSFYFAKEVAQHLPDVEWRLNRLAVRRLEIAEYQRRTEGMALEKPNASIALEGRLWLKSEEGQAAVAAEIERLRPSITPLTEEHL